MPEQPVVVVGAGLGGLAAALRLKKLGQRVIVLEKTDQVGGRNREIQVGPTRFDAGPTLVMMLDPFRRLFADVGERIEDHLDLTLCNPSYRVFYADGSRIDATAKQDVMAERIRALAGEADSIGFEKFLNDVRALNVEAVPKFVERNYRGPLDLVRLGSLATVMRHGMLGNLAKRVAGYVRDERIRMLLSFQTMYLGLSPYEAPWVYAVLAHMEFEGGIWYPTGGVVEICQSVARLAARHGVDIRLNALVQSIEGSSVILESGERIDAKAIVCNADLPYAEGALLGKRVPNRRYSCSAFMQYLDYEGELPDLLHHNVFFGSDLRGNLDAIFGSERLPEEPAFYAAISCRTDPGRSVPGHLNLYLLTPCPNLDYPWSNADANSLRQHNYDRLEREVGFEPNRVRESKEFTPLDWRDVLNLDRGAAFGLSHHFLQSAAFRPANRSRTNPSVFFVGASTVPGNGLPMTLISAELVVERMAKDRAI